MSAVLFFIGAIGTIAGAAGVVTLRDPFLAVLSLVVHLLFLAVLFLLLRSEFLAAAQVVVYAGAVMVLYVFVVAYVGEEVTLGAEKGPVGSGLRIASTVFGAVLLVELFIALLGTGLHGIDTKGSAYIPGFGTPRYIGNLLLTRFLLTFEIASFLLLIAAVGAVVLARRRGGIAEERQEEIVLSSYRRPIGTGTTAEAVSTLAFAAAHQRHDHGTVEEEPPPAVVGSAPEPADPPEPRTGGGW